MIELRSYVNDIKPYKPGKPIDEVVRELGITGDVIKLASNENPLGPSPKAVQAIGKRINTINLYPDDNCFYLKKAISAKFNMPGDQVIVGSGSVELIELIFKAYVNPGDEVIMSDPSFIMYKIACQIYGGKRIAIPLQEYHHDIDSIARAITEKTKILILDNPINPTGTIIDEARFHRFVEQVPDDIILVADEAYREYIENADYPKTMDYLKQKNNVVILYTFSKIYGLAGLRVGYGFASPDIISALMKVRLPFNVNSIAQIGAAAALDDTAFVQQSQKNNEAGKEYLYKELPRIGLAFTPTYGNFILVHFQTEARDIFEKLQARGVITRTVMEYGLPNALRITIGTPHQNEQLIRCLTEIV
ncbi:histidinol-phosphate transaminase [candidate division WOR-3 bacterium]|nr:histidinol-phosphate transaminase [candidate division WOR-3 bacterium]